MDFESFREKASLLTLPIETRFMIYDLIISRPGSLVVFAQYELTRNVDTQTIHLLHVNRLVRAEVHEYFYKNQRFQFRSFQAMEKFLEKIGPYYTGIIKNVMIGSWLAQRALFAEQIAPLLTKLTSIERLTIQAPAHGFVTEWSEQAELGDKAVAVLQASERLAAGKIYLAWVYAYGKGAIQFIAQNVPHPAEEAFPLHSIFGVTDKYRWYHWRNSGFMHYVEVRGSEYLLESTNNQNPKGEVKVAMDKISSTSYFFNDDDDPDL